MKQPVAILVLQCWYTILVIPVFYLYLPVSAILVQILVNASIPVSSRIFQYQANFLWPYVIESRLNDLNYIVNTATRRKKRQICQVTAQGFSKDYRLIVDASDVGVGAVLLQEGKDDIDLPNCYFS
jgi:hypothetical protein